ncbi:CvpA family protein [Pseudoroseomonas wenyumeiae]
MTWVDGLVLAVLALSALIAYFRGLVREVLGIGAWAGAIAFALYAQPAVKPLAMKYLTTEWMAELAALAVAFLLALLVLKLLIGWFAGIVRHSVLGGGSRSRHRVWPRKRCFPARTRLYRGRVVPACHRPLAGSGAECPDPAGGGGCGPGRCVVPAGRIPPASAGAA